MYSKIGAKKNILIVAKILKFLRKKSSINEIEGNSVQRILVA